MELRLYGLPMPPSDNRLHRHGFQSYASVEYVEWLGIVRPILVDALGPCYTPDAENWWGVTMRLSMNAGDGPNRIKGCLDWLSGRFPLEHAAIVNGKKRSKGALVNGPGLWVDDKRVRWVLPLVVTVRCSEPTFDLVARPVRPPIDERQVAEDAARAEKAQAKADALAADELAVTAALVTGPRTFAEIRLGSLVISTEMSEGATRRALKRLQEKDRVWNKNGKPWHLR